MLLNELISLKSNDKLWKCMHRIFFFFNKTACVTGRRDSGYRLVTFMQDGQFIVQPLWTSTLLPWVLNLSEKHQLYEVQLLKVLLLSFKNHLLLKIYFVQINLYYRITSSFLGNINQKEICPHMHMYVHAQIHAQYCHIWG